MKRCADLLAKASGGPVKSIEQNLWTVVSRKADPADSGEMSLLRKRKEHEKQTLRKR